MKRPAASGSKAAAATPDDTEPIMKRPAAGATFRRAHMGYYARENVYGIKWQGREVMRVGNLHL